METNIPLSSLRKLEIRNVSDLSLKQIATISTLQELSLENCNLQSEAPTQLTQLQNLRFLDLADSLLRDALSLGDAFAPVLCKLPHLAGLNLWSTKLTDTGLAHIAKITNLTFLNVMSCEAITDVGVLCLQKLPLRRIDFSEAQITNSAISNCLGKMQLEKLSLAGCGKISAGVLAGLQHVALLEELDLSNIQQADEMLSGIERATNLKTLDVSRTNVTGDFLKNIEKLKLQSLKLHDTKIQVDKLQSLSKITTLTSLSLGGLPITDTEIQHISKLLHLRALDLSDTLITDIGLSLLSNLTYLSSLNVLNCHALTNNGLVEFAKRRRLLRFQFCKAEKILHDVVALLQKLMPQCALPSIFSFV